MMSCSPRISLKKVEDLPRQGRRNINLIKGVAAAVPAEVIDGVSWNIYNVCEAEVFGGVFELWPLMDGLWECVKCL